MDATHAWADGLASVTGEGSVVDVWYPAPALGEPDTPDPTGAGLDLDLPIALRAAGGDLAGDRATELPIGLRAADGRRDEIRGLSRRLRRTLITLADPPTDTADGFLRLHLLSHRLVRPNELNLDGIFAVLPNNAWTTLGPVPVADLDAVRLRALAAGVALGVTSVDKFPRMTDYVVPSGVRIGDADRVRLGAHLASGTTVMHEGFVNFNAGTLGTSMVEGRIVAGVLVGDGSDIGAGASIMGTLSGGGTQRVSIGERCLLGANAGIGISLGDDCVVEAGLYVTAGTKVTLPDGTVVKARQLSGSAGLLYWRNSTTGAVEARPRQGNGIVLNEALHAN